MFNIHHVSEGKLEPRRDYFWAMKMESKDFKFGFHLEKKCHSE